MMRRVAVLLPFVACIALYAGAMRGFFLSDDMSVLFVLGGLESKGHLWGALFQKFAGGLDAQSHYYRPLPFLSYGVNLAMSLDPLPWHLVNLAGHLAGGAAVYRISALLRGGVTAKGTPGWTPALAAALFLLCGTSAEAVAWISGRYDVFATALLLWAGALYLQSRRAADANAMGAWLCGILALTSKESAAVLPGLIGCLAWIRHGALPIGPRWRAILRDLAPWLALIAAYFALRFVLFGSMFQVYPGTHPLERLRDGSWLPTPNAGWTWLATALPNAKALVVALVLSVALALIAIANLARHPALRRPLIGMIGATLLSLVLLLPHLSGFPANGEGGRLLYTTTALGSIAIALGLALPGTELRSRGAVSLAMLAAPIAIALIVAHAILLNAALRTWRSAGAQMAALASALARVPESIQPGGYGFVFAPDAIGAAPFARNANGALVVPPIQRGWLLNRVVVSLPADVPYMPGHLKMQLIPLAKRLTLNDAGDRLDDPRPGTTATEVVWPSDLFCWNLRQSKVLRVALPQQPPPDPDVWIRDVRAALRSAGCDYVPPQ
jgi:hypothetical protein